MFPESDPDTMIATPTTTPAMAPQVLPVILSPKRVHESSAAINGPPACISRMLATVV